MNVEELKAYCDGFLGAESRALGHPYNVLIHSIGGKQFAYFKLSEPEK